MRHVGEQRAERHDELDLELLHELEHERRSTSSSAGSARRRAGSPRRGRDPGSGRGGTCSTATRACASGRPRARRSDARPGSRRSSPSRSRRTAPRPTASRDSRRRASRPGRRRSSRGRRRRAPGGGGRAARRRSAPTFPESSRRRSGARDARRARPSRRRAAAAVATWTTTTHHGTLPYVRYCTSPIPICTSEDREQPGAPAQQPRDTRCAAPGPGGEHEEHDPERGDGAHVPVDGGIERAEPRHDVASRSCRGTGRPQSRPCR